MNSKLIYYLFPLLAVPLYGEIPLWILISSAVFWSMPKRLSHSAIKFLAIASSVLVYYQFKSLLGVEAGTSLTLLMLGLKFHELKKPGDQMVVLFTYKILVLSHLLFFQSIFISIYAITLFVVFTFCFMCINDPNKSPKQIWTENPKIIGKDFALALPIFAAMFFLFPRFNVSIGNLLSSQKSVSGFSGDFAPGAFANLALSDEIAFRVDMKNQKLTQQDMYWRGQTLSITDGFSWKKIEPKKYEDHKNFQDQNLKSVSYSVILEPQFQKTLFSLDFPYSLEWQYDSKNRIAGYEDATYEALFPLIQRGFYNGKSFLVQNRKWNGLIPSADLQLPTNLSDEFKKFVAQFKLASPQSSIQSVLNYFKSQGFSYSLSTPQMNSVDDFLFKHKAGFCEHYASSFALIMRAIGIPSRVVIGFQGAEYNEFGNYYLIREKFAHAWTEVWTPNDGWVRVDPTAAINQIRTDNRIQLTQTQLEISNPISKVWLNASLFVDSINNRYMLFMANYNYDTQKNFLEKLGLKNISRRQIYLILFIIVGFIIVLFYFYQKFYESKQDKIMASYQDLILELKKMGYEKSDNEGSFSFARRIPEENIQQLLLDYTMIKYGPENSQTLKKQFIENVKNFRRTMS